MRFIEGLRRVVLGYGSVTFLLGLGLAFADFGINPMKLFPGAMAIATATLAAAIATPRDWRVALGLIALGLLAAVGVWTLLDESMFGRLGQAQPPPWFTNDDLAFALMSGPSALATLFALLVGLSSARANRGA